MIFLLVMVYALGLTWVACALVSDQMLVNEAQKWIQEMQLKLDKKQERL